MYGFAGVLVQLNPQRKRLTAVIHFLIHRVIIHTDNIIIAALQLIILTFLIKFQIATISMTMLDVVGVIIIYHFFFWFKSNYLEQITYYLIYKIELLMFNYNKLI